MPPSAGSAADQGGPQGTLFTAVRAVDLAAVAGPMHGRSQVVSSRLAGRARVRPANGTAVAWCGGDLEMPVSPAQNLLRSVAMEGPRAIGRGAVSRFHRGSGARADASFASSRPAVGAAVPQGAIALAGTPRGAAEISAP
jgi:hypothetical protein